MKNYMKKVPASMREAMDAAMTPEFIAEQVNWIIARQEKPKPKKEKQRSKLAVLKDTFAKTLDAQAAQNTALYTALRDLTNEALETGYTSHTLDNALAVLAAVKKKI